MNTVQARIPRWIGGYQPTPAPRWPAGQAAEAKPANEVETKSFQLTWEESARFFRVVAECEDEAFAILHELAVAMVEVDEMCAARA